MSHQELTQDFLKTLFWYDSCTGNFYNKKTMKIAGSKNDMYVKISINSKLYYAHRLVFLYLLGYIPSCNVDHVNANKKDNRFENLRICRNGQSDNNQNSAIYKNNQTGFIGVWYDKKRKKFEAKIKIKNKQHFLGYFQTAGEAHAAYKRKKSEIHRFQPFLEGHHYGSL